MVEVNIEDSMSNPFKGSKASCENKKDHEINTQMFVIYSTMSMLPT